MNGKGDTAESLTIQALVNYTFNCSPQPFHRGVVEDNFLNIRQRPHSLTAPTSAPIFRLQYLLAKFLNTGRIAFKMLLQHVVHVILQMGMHLFQSVSPHVIRGYLSEKYIRENFSDYIFATPGIVENSPI